MLDGRKRYDVRVHYRSGEVEDYFACQYLCWLGNDSLRFMCGEEGKELTFVGCSYRIELRTDC